MTEIVTQEQLEALDDYERGWIDGVATFAWWKDGTTYVGTTGKTQREAVQKFLSERGKGA